MKRAKKRKQVKVVDYFSLEAITKRILKYIDKTRSTIQKRLNLIKGVSI